MFETSLTVVKVEWGNGYYKNGVLVDYHRTVWDRTTPQRIERLCRNCEIKNVDMTYAGWTRFGEGFPERLEDALNKNFISHSIVNGKEN